MEVDRMRSSGIGGQAVMEGIMMKNGDAYALAVRLSDGQIQVEPGEYKGFIKGKKILELPFVRGVFNFVDSMVLGIKTLTRSADLALEGEKAAEAAKKNAGAQEKAGKKGSSGDNGLMMAMTVALSIALAVGLFMVLPVLIASPIKQLGAGPFWIALVEGIIRLLIFFVYVKLISKMEDIQRVFMYHGAEHKCINCIEHGLELTVDNVRDSSRLHKRCGTSFLLLVMLVSLLVFMFVRVETVLLRIVSRVLLLPVIAGISYEVLKLAGRSESPIVCLISKPGLAMQKLTTREPDDSMIEVAIRAVEAVFDWKTFVSEVKEEQEKQK